MPVKIHGLPAHVLLIHAVVVLLPLAALMVIASAGWPKARRKLGFLTPATALVALVLVPITTHAGEWLRDRLPESERIEKHAQLGHNLLPWAIGLFVVAAGVWLLGRRYELSLLPARNTPPPPPAPAAETSQTSGGVATATRTAPATQQQALPVWVSAVVALIAVGVSVGAMVQLIRVGDSGAQAVWNGIANLPKRGG